MKPLWTRTPVLVLITLTMFQSACGPSAPAEVANTPVAAQQPTMTASPETGLCQNDFIPAKPGATWTYKGQIGTAAHTRVMSISAVSTDTIQGRMRVTDDTGKVVLDAADTWQCTSAGLVQLAGPLGATLQGAYGNATLKTISTTGVTVPTHINPGDSWSQVSQLELTSEQSTFTGTLTYDFKAIGFEQLSVPAGAFNAMKVQVHASTQAVVSGQTVNVTVDGFEWFAPGVGHLKSSETVYAYGIPFAHEESVLQSYTIP